MPEEMPHNTIRRYLDLGWVIQPTKANSKSPIADDWPDLPAETRLSRYRHGVFLVTGARSGVSVIDLDSDEWFDEFAPLVHKKTPYARTPRGGAHILVSHSQADWWTNRVNYLPKLDLRNDRGGIVLPHVEKGRHWASGHAPWQIHLADPGPFEALIEKLYNQAGAKAGHQQRQGSDSTLAGLLGRPPSSGARSDWLTRVAGHLVPLIPWEDAYQQMIQVINQALPEPLDSDEVTKTIGKLWKRDRSRNPIDPSQLDPPTEVHEGKLYLWRGMGKSRERHLWLEPAIEVTQSLQEPHGAVSWKVRNGEREATLRPADVHNSGRLAVTLGNIGVVMYPRAVGGEPNGAILQKWLQQQEAPSVVMCPYWGWSDELGVWVGLDEQATGPEGYEPIIGWVDRPDIIEQLPTWQQDHTAAVFCSWVALQAAKGKAPYSIEPNMVLQGPAGAGKTRGLFSFGSRLTGSERMSSATFAVLRDRIAKHRNGIVVIDDHAALESNAPKLLELYRVSTSSEALGLKQESVAGWADRKVPLVGSMLVSGESLMGLSDDRALRDRSVILEVEPASARRSLVDTDLPQWADIQRVFSDLGGSDETTAHQLAGPFINRILQAVEQIGPPDVGSGERVSTKLGLVKYGAQLWQAAYPGSRTYEGKTLIEAVDEWCSTQSQTSGWADTSLVRKILPATVDPVAGAVYAVKIDPDTHQVCVHVERLSRFWCRTHLDTRSQEIGSVDNIRRELNVLKNEGQAESGRSIRFAGDPKKGWVLGPEASAHILAEAGMEATNE